MSRGDHREPVDLEGLLADLPNPSIPAGFLERALALEARPPLPPLRYSLFSMPFGRLFVAFDQAVVLTQVGGHQLSFEDAIREELRRQPEAVEPPPGLRAAMEALAEGADRTEYPVDLQRLGRFQQRVLAATQAIPRGTVLPYQSIARAIGAPGSARAVGTALARNPVPIVIPCHRVVRTDARLGEYSGGGAEVKAAILRWEGVPIQARAGSWRVIG